MSDRTRSNTNFGKLPLSRGLQGTQTFSDRLEEVSKLVTRIIENKRRLAKDMSYKTVDSKFIAKCNACVKDCLHTIRTHLKQITKDDDMISKILKYIETGDYKSAKDCASVISATLNPQVYGTKYTQKQRG